MGRGSDVTECKRILREVQIHSPLQSSASGLHDYIIHRKISPRGICIYGKTIQNRDDCKDEVYVRAKPP